MKQLAIIGMGPRGLYALEQLLTQLEKLNKQVAILIFEASDEPGAGNVWHTKQPDSNWINTAERALTKVDKRKTITYNKFAIESFPSYHQWCQFSQNRDQPDTFPARHKLGKYLNERFKSIHNSLNPSDSYSFIKTKVLEINLEGKRLKIKSNHHSWTCDDILLTIGHQSIQLSNPLKQWVEYSKKYEALNVFENAYPVSQFNDIINKTNLSIGIRGFGLTMIDVMRYLVINNFGNFKVVDFSTFETVYYKVKAQHLKLIPFTLYGLPLAPKPLNASIDNWFKPKSEELEQFKIEIKSVAQTENNFSSVRFLIRAFSKIAARVFLDLKSRAVEHSFEASEIETVVFKSLETYHYRHQLFQDDTITTYKIIETYIKMALGTVPISLDYCIGQVWRHCQPTLYTSFSHAKINTKIIKELIDLNEHLKRYTFGPPIESMQQILALIDANILILDFIKDPEITMTNDGWQFKNEQNKVETCTVLINSVIDAPKLLETNTPIVKSLLHNNLIQPIHPELGVKTYSNGYVKGANNTVPIAILGSLAKGSIVGVDSISESFGPLTENWAKFYVDNLET